MQWTLKPWADLTCDELYAVMVARQEVFVVEQNCPYLDADGWDSRALHLWATPDDALVVHAYLRVFAPGVRSVEASLGRVITTQAGRGTGLGRELLKRGIETVRERFGAVRIRIGAQKYLVRFYGDFGFVSLGDDYLEDGIVHVEMLREA
jgi:ElaA protein